MRAILKRVGEEACVVDVDLTLKYMQDVVGGYVEYVPIGPDVDVICNEEGMYAGDDGGLLPQNAAGFLGNILIVASNDAGDSRSLTDEEVRKALAYLVALSDVKHLGVAVFGIATGEEALRRARAAAKQRQAFWEAL